MRKQVKNSEFQKLIFIVSHNNTLDKTKAYTFLCEVFLYDTRTIGRIPCICIMRRWLPDGFKLCQLVFKYVDIKYQ